VQQVNRPALAGFAQLLVEPERGPVFEPKRLILGRLAFIGKAVWGRVSVAFSSGALDIVAPFSFAIFFIL